jgi:hypothetical protein
MGQRSADRPLGDNRFSRKYGTAMIEKMLAWIQSDKHLVRTEQRVAFSERKCNLFILIRMDICWGMKNDNHIHLLATL